MAKDVFLSYSTEDSSTATAVREHLEAHNIGCWMAPRDITPGNDYVDQIITAIESTRTFMLILSKKSNCSGYVRNEVERAVARGKVIIPFLIHRVELSRNLEFFISNRQWIEAWEPPLPVRVNVLVEAIRKHLGNCDSTSALSSASQALHLTRFSIS